MGKSTLWRISESRRWVQGGMQGRWKIIPEQFAEGHELCKRNRLASVIKRRTFAALMLM